MNLADAWRMWEKQVKVYFKAAELKSKKIQITILLHVAGPDAQEVCESFEYAHGENKDDYKTVLT